MPDTLKPQTLSVKTQHGRYGVRILLHEVRELIAFLHVAKTEIWVKGERNEVKGDIIPKPEMNYPILVCYHPFANIHDLNSTMTVPVKSYRAKGGTNDVSLDICPMMRKQVIFSLPLFLWFQKCSPLCSQGCYTPLPAWLSLSQISYVNKLFICCFACCWILSALRQKDLSFSMSWYQMSSFN